MKEQASVDVLIIGAGPTGTTLAIDLVRRGLRVRIIDRAAQSFSGSCAKGVQPRTLEVFEDLGVLEPILAGGSRYPKMQVHLGVLSVPWKMFAEREASPAVPFANTCGRGRHQRSDRGTHR